MKTAVVIAIGMAALTSSLGARAEQKKVDQKFCAAAVSFQTDVAELNAIGPHSTVAELRAVQSRMDKDVEHMQMAASLMGTPTAKRFLEATNQLDKDINSVPNDETLQQVHSKIAADVQNAQSAGEALATEDGGPSRRSSSR